jgi:hypothetical protein
MGRTLAFRQWKILLRRIIRHLRRRVSRWLRREEALEDSLRLESSGVSKVHPHVHTAWAAECRIQALNMVRRSEQEAIIEKASTSDVAKKNDTSAHRPSAAVIRLKRHK